MAVTLVIGDNSYIDLDYANNYFSERLYTDPWNSAGDDTKVKAILMATKKIERQPLQGRKAVNNQVLQFPRMIYSYNNYNWLDSYFVTENGNKYITSSQGWIIESEVSERVKQAVCEEALALLEFGNNKRLKLQQQGVKSFSVSKLSETYTGSTIKILSQEAKELLQPYLATSVEIY
ncbi:MAG: hypothetical protein Q8936_01705 [Bacillota bacterium]|nr:hypothetical protein [Bacillota bacterium]